MQKIATSTTTANQAGEFTEGSSSAGIEATRITAAWLNTLQRELANVLGEAGINLAPEDDRQLAKAVLAIIAARLAAVETPPRFDNDTSLATTEFAKLMGLEFSSVKELTASAELLPSDAGKVVRIAANAASSLTLPALTKVPQGAAFLIKNASIGVLVAVLPAGTDTVYRQIKIPPLSSVLIVARPASATWSVVGGSAEVLDQINANVIGQLGMRNRLINGNFAAWQRGTSFTLSNETRFVADRFIAYTGAGGACSVVKNIHAVGRQLGGQYLTLNQTKAATTPPLLTQRVESVRSLEGRKASLSLTASASVPLACQVQIRQSFGSGGSPSAMVETIVGSFTVPGDNVSARQEIVFDMPSINGKTIGTNADDFIEVMLLMPAGVTFALNTWDWQLEEGAIATPFEVRPYALELLLCQRYYEVGTFAMEAYGAAGNYMRCLSAYRAPKRANPTVTLESVSYSSSLNAPAISDGTVYGFSPRFPINTTGQQGATGIYRSDAEL